MERPHDQSVVILELVLRLRTPLDTMRCNRRWCAVFTRIWWVIVDRLIYQIDDFVERNKPINFSTVAPCHSDSVDDRTIVLCLVVL